MLTLTALKIGLAAAAVAGGGAVTVVTLRTAGPLAPTNHPDQAAVTATPAASAIPTPTLIVNTTGPQPSGTPYLTPYVVTAPAGTPTRAPFTPWPTPTPLPGTQAQVPPLPPAAPIPADWKTFSQPATSETGAFSFRYPSTWTVGPQPPPPPGFPPRGYTLVLSSWDPAGKSGGGALPSDGVKLDLVVNRLSYNTTCSTAKPTMGSLGNVPARLGLYIDPSPSASRFVRVYDFEAERDGFRYCMSVGFTMTVTGSTPRVEVLSQILSTLTFS